MPGSEYYEDNGYYCQSCGTKVGSRNCPRYKNYGGETKRFDLHNGNPVTYLLDWCKDCYVPHKPHYTSARIRYENRLFTSELG